MRTETLAELRRLLAAASPGPWVCVEEPEFVGIFSGDVGPHVADAYRADAALIVAAVNALPALLDAAEAAPRWRSVEEAWERIAAKEEAAEIGHALNRVLGAVGAQAIEFDHDGETTYARTFDGREEVEGDGRTLKAALVRLADALTPAAPGETR